MQLLIQFLLRLCFGLTAGMAITSSRQVTSGYFRNHMYVTLGLATLAAMVSYSVAPEAFWYAAGAAVASYVGSVCWLYEKATAGKLLLFITMMCSLESLFNSQVSNALWEKTLWGKTETRVSRIDIPAIEENQDNTAEQAAQLKEQDLRKWVSAGWLSQLSMVTSSLLLGMTMAAMLLGHWYLNTPTMELAPLRRLILAMGVAIVLQMIVSALGLWGELQYAQEISTQWWLFLLLRWSFGLVGVAILAWMAWQTLKIPNTQSATGILYVAVIGTFVGETMAMLLSAQSLFPL